MKVGAERRKVAILVALLLVLCYFLYTNLAPAGGESTVVARSTPPVAQKQEPADGVFSTPAPEVRPRPPLRPGRQSQLKLTFSNAKVDPTTIDPTLRLDLMAKLQAVTLEGGERNLFQFGPAPMPKAPEPKVIPMPATPPPAAAEVKPAEPVKPPPPPIPLKFFGFTSGRSGEKRAFFLDGEDILVAREGDTMKRRYKVVRIGVNSVVVEDTDHKHEQTLPLEPEQTAGMQ